MPLVAGIDSSTQSCKVVIRDAESGRLVREGSARHPDGTEVDPQEWWTALQQAVTNAGGLEDVGAISIGGQQHGMVVLDAQGHVIRPAILWNDTRSASEAAEIERQFGADYLVNKTGSIPVASFTSTKLLWLKTHEPEAAARVAAVALPHDWLSWRLAGYGPAGESTLGPDLAALATDRSDASGTGYFDSRENAYVSEILEFALGHVPVLPRIVAPGEPAFDTGSCVVACGAGDNAAAALGVGAREGDAIVSLGTSGTVFAVSPLSTHDATGTIAGFASASQSFLPLVCTLNSARVLDAFAALLEVTHDELGELALTADPGAGGITLIPFFEGERTPNLPDAQAEISGLTLTNTTRANMARAAIEGMLCGLGAGLDALRESGIECDRILLVGGAAANRAVQHVAGEVFGIPVIVPEPGEYVANGAARQAAHLLLGRAPDWQLTLVTEVDVPAQPIIRQQYARALARFL